MWSQSRLKQLQSKLVQGGVNLMDRDEEQRKAAAALEDEIAERKRQEQELLEAQVSCLSRSPPHTPPTRVPPSVPA